MPSGQPFSSDDLVSLSKRTIAHAERSIAEAEHSIAQLQKSIAKSLRAIEASKRMIAESEVLIARAMRSTEPLQEGHGPQDLEAAPPNTGSEK